MKKPTAVLAALLMIACSNTGAAVAVASLGIAGAGLTAYCVSGGAGCSPSLIAYGTFVTTQATKAAAVLESGQSTPEQLQEIVDNLTNAVVQGEVLTGLTATQRQEVQAIVATANSVISLVRALIPPPVVATPLAAVRAPVRLPALSASDRSKLADMRAKIQSTK